MATTQTDEQVKNGDIRVRVIQDNLDHDGPRDWDNPGKMCCWHKRYDLGDKHDFKTPADMFLEILQDAPVHVLKKLRTQMFQDEADGEQYREAYDELMEGLNRMEREDRLFDFIREQLGGHENRHDTQMLAEAAGEVAEILPLYLYDHSGITMSTSSTTYRMMDSAGWDWGCVGYIWMTHKRFIEETGYATAREKETLQLGKQNLQKCRELLESEVETYDQYLTGDVYGFVIEKAVVCSHCGDIKWEDIDSCWGFYGHDPKENGMFDHVDEKYRDMLREAFDNVEAG